MHETLNSHLEAQPEAKAHFLLYMDLSSDLERILEAVFVFHRVSRASMD